jgi:GntR family transcriptional regulator
MTQTTPASRLLDRLRLEADGVPIYVQVREQVLHALAAGVLAPGDQMPTLRQVAVALRIDMNTVRRAYEALERAGAIRVEHGRGAFVADAAAVEPGAQAAALDKFARKTLARAHALGLPAQELVRRLGELASIEGDPT